MALRESKRHRDKRPFIPFGDMMLPVIGFVAVGLLVAGSSFFFSPDQNRKIMNLLRLPNKSSIQQMCFPYDAEWIFVTDKQPVFRQSAADTVAFSRPEREYRSPFSALAVPYSKSGKQESDKVRMDEDASIKTNTVQRKRNSKSSAAQTRKIGDVPIVANNAKEKKNVAPVSPSRTKNEEKQSAKVRLRHNGGCRSALLPKRTLPNPYRPRSAKKVGYYCYLSCSP